MAVKMTFIDEGFKAILKSEEVAEMVYESADEICQKAEELSTKCRHHGQDHYLVRRWKSGSRSGATVQLDLKYYFNEAAAKDGGFENKYEALGHIRKHVHMSTLRKAVAACMLEQPAS